MTSVAVGQRLPQAPLVQVIAQIRFGEISAIDQHVEALRRSFKALGLPLYVPGTLQRIAILAGGEPEVSATPRWDFFDLHRHHGLVLTRDFLLLQTSEYSGFRDFSVRLHGAITALAQAIGDEAVTRVGLRYVDLVRAPGPDTDVREMVVPGLRGYPVEGLVATRGQAPTSRHETVVPTAAGVLAVRSQHRAVGGFLPPDLGGDGLEYNIPALGPEEPVIVLDFDHYVPAPAMLLDPSAIVGVFGSLHEVMTEAFWSAVTDTALTHRSRKAP